MRALAKLICECVERDSLPRGGLSAIVTAELNQHASGKARVVAVLKLEHLGAQVNAPRCSQRCRVAAPIGQEQQVQELVGRFCAARFELCGVALAICLDLLQKRRDGRRTQNQHGE